MKAWKAAVLVATASNFLASAAPAFAAGSGNSYLDMQTGVTYTVYQPTFTAGLKQQHVGPNLMTTAGVDQNLLATFGKGNGRNMSIGQGNPMTQDISPGQVVQTLTIAGQPAKVYAYCDPSSTAKCTLKDVGKWGGHLTVTLPAGAGLRETIVQVETIQPKPISGQQLIQVAQGLKPVK